MAFLLHPVFQEIDGNEASEPPERIITDTITRHFHWYEPEFQIITDTRKYMCLSWRIFYWRRRRVDITYVRIKIFPFICHKMFVVRALHNILLFPVLRNPFFFKTLPVSVLPPIFTGLIGSLLAVPYHPFQPVLLPSNSPRTIRVSEI